MSDSVLEVINEGDTVRLRDGTVTTVDFIAYMPDDLITGYEYVVRLSGHEAATYTSGGLFCEDDESPIDIIEVQGKLS
ncbi:hypothetical protein V6380_16310 [Acinetobacter variabilis]|uniref:hypothetical protein n=1 Tax=Acinetobacter variabilis TaxID=70346 RepID=UPI003B83DDA1